MIAKAVTVKDPSHYPQPSETFGYALEARGSMSAPDTSGFDLSLIAAASYESTAVFAYNGPQKAENAPVRAEREQDMLSYIKYKESSGNPTAQNPKSSAYGLYGFLDGTWDDVGCTKTSDPKEQERCAILYMEQRYGGIEGAYYFHIANDYY